MQPALKTLFTALAFAASAATTFAGDKPHWGYSGAEGPQNWGTLTAEYALCGTGKNQSPVNLDRMIEAELAPLKFDYGSAAAVVLNNGHTIQASFAEGSGFDIDGHRFELKQIHFHAPSENLINGESFPLEGHMVHADKDGNLAVVALMYRLGTDNPALHKIWVQMPEHAGDKIGMRSVLKAEDLLPANRDYYRFNGSLTTPPCSEGVTWLVMKEPVAVGKAQVKLFEHLMHHPNNRPVQAVNARPLLK